MKVSMRTAVRCIAACAVLLWPLLSSCAEPSPLPEDVPAAKFAIGPLISQAIDLVKQNPKPVMEALQSAASYVSGKLSENRAAAAQAPQKPAPQGNAPCYYSQNGSGMSKGMRDQMGESGCQPMAQEFPPAPAAVSHYVTPTTRPAARQPQLKVSASGVPNYQGVKVTVVMADEEGRTLGERPIGNEFLSGERFRLKIQPTFSGLLEIDHVSPAGERTQLFPKPGMGEFLVSAGAEVSLPLGDAIYEFDTEGGDEQLIFKVRDPRITDTAQYGGAMMVQDLGNATFLGQQMAGEGQLPYIAHSILIQHH